MGRDQFQGIERRGDSIRVKFTYRGVECRETLRLPPTPANLKYATRLRGEIINAIEKKTFRYGDYFPDSKRAILFGHAAKRITIGQLLRDLEATTKKAVDKGNMSPATLNGYRKIIHGHLLPKFDEKAVQDLTSAELREWIAGLDATAKTVRNILGPLRSVLGDCLNDGMIESNPLDKIDLAKLLAKTARKSEYDVDPFDLEEMRVILAKAESETRNLFQFAFWTGLRTSEVIALSWPEIDLHAGIVRVRHAVVVKQLKQPKTDAGNREVMLLPSARAAIEAQRAYTQLAGGRVFRFQGHPLQTDKQIREWLWRPLLAAAGVRYRNPYQTRHTYASMLLSRGENPLWVANQMGHVDTEMINRHYGKWMPDKAAKAGYEPVNAWDEFAQEPPSVARGTSEGS